VSCAQLKLGLLKGGGYIRQQKLKEKKRGVAMGGRGYFSRTDLTIRGVAEPDEGGPHRKSQKEDRGPTAGGPINCGLTNKNGLEYLDPFFQN